MRIAEAKDLKSEFFIMGGFCRREGYSRKMVEFDRGNGGSNVGNVRGSGSRIIGYRSDEYVNRKGRFLGQ